MKPTTTAVFRIGLQLGPLQNVDQKSGEERARAQRDDAEIEKDPQPEREAIIHVRLVQPVVQAQASRINSDSEHHSPRSQPQQESRERNALFSSGNPAAVG